MQALLAPMLLLSAALGQDVPPSPAPLLGTRVGDFELRDEQGRAHRLSDWHDSKLVAVVFLGVECPVAKLYAARLVELEREFGPRGVAFVAVDANKHDSAEDLAGFARERGLTLPFLRDVDNVLADRLGATRTAEAFLLDAGRVLRYHGRVDDQYAPGMHRTRPTHRDLADAVEDLLAGRPVARPETPAPGCKIDRVRPRSARGAVTYCRDVAPVLQKHCVACHRPGNIGPFSLLTYRDAADWAETIREVVDEGRMPPWHADPRYGHFANDPSLTARERQLLDDWVGHGTTEGDPADLPPPPAFANDWDIPSPDVVVSLPRPETVPAEGVLDYRFIEVDPGFREDKWVRAAEVRPGNRAVVHHCLVFLKPPGGEMVARGELKSYYLAGTAVGTRPVVLPQGMAKLVPAGWHLVFVLHYTPIGRVQTDQTSIGLVLADPKAVTKEVATNVMIDGDLSIPPHAADHRVEHSVRLEHDVLLLAMFPHMHLRGKSFRYEAGYPDGTAEVLLDVPHYDFNWQHRYLLAEPKRLPAGTVLRCTAHYDNSAGNPNNPDPEATVHTGPQSTDEMFNGDYEIALADQDLTRPPPPGATLYRALRRLGQPIPALVVISVCAMFLVVRRWRRSRAGNH
jgi:peroxiredoxin